MQQTSTLPPVVEADEIAARGFLTRTELGQHFLRSSEAARRLLGAIDIPADAHVIEVGAGLGTLSRTIALAGYRLWAIEKDERLRQQLTGQLAEFGSRARLTIGDVRHVDLEHGVGERGVLVSIMPFDPELSVALTKHVLSFPAVTRGLVVLPCAAADRLASETGHQLEVEEVDGISRSDFWPEASTVLRVVTIEKVLPCRS
ncbi:rRNA adenine N-6-methyltransferase family protein [Streptomyces sp. NPDC088745]|uniref:rRNA adenine N-6-methyltransferase family protein n=1 Tax=Streptomyces sp. NPDC088745 TaxID=3365884 RepID=UPI0037F34D68